MEQLRRKMGLKKKNHFKKFLDSIILPAFLKSEFHALSFNPFLTTRTDAKERERRVNKWGWYNGERDWGGAGFISIPALPRAWILDFLSIPAPLQRRGGYYPLQIGRGISGIYGGGAKLSSQF
ncbi:hypothetical protein CRG98_013217 [Punica granatum]|uniref:Uncharacterized protein n=1 Tax=Punica granatum TaxID=22663 RepID=A0A2I0KD06_PUNGR|nr:hypothetical protein CRG98_013217 [Punica granatum]